MAITAVRFSIFFHFIFVGNRVDPESVYGRQNSCIFQPDLLGYNKRRQWGERKHKSEIVANIQYTNEVDKADKVDERTDF